MGGVRYREKFRLLLKRQQFIKNKFNVHPRIKKKNEHLSDFASNGIRD